MPVYLLHSSVPVVRPNGQEVRHYLGHVKEGRLGERLKEHQLGRHSSAIVREMRRLGGKLYIGRYWPEYDLEDERRLKRNGHIGEHCLLCKVQAIELEMLGWPT